MAKAIILKPVVSEKSEDAVTKLNQYTFVVAKDANKVEVRKAVEKMFNVQVTHVSTLIRPGKQKSRSTKSSIARGQTSAIKKAVVTLAEGESIDNFFGSIEPTEGAAE